MKKVSFFLICGVISSIIFFSCRKSTLIGDELIPQSDYLFSERTDTFSIITNTLLDDSSATSFNFFFGLGSLNSSVFGKTAANIYTQIVLPTNNLFFGVDAVVDSVVLMLDYATIYGDSTANQSVNVFKLLDDIDPTRVYYSNSKLHELRIPVATKTFIPNLTDSVEVYGVKYAPHLRIKMQNWFADEVFDQTDTTKFDNTINFQKYIKGLLIEADVSSGYGNSVMQFDMASASSGLTIYYHNATADSLYTRFPLTGLKHNYFTHDYSGTEIETKLSSADTILGDDKIYVQGFSGVKSFIKIPYLTQLKNVGINKAEIIFTIEGELDTVFDAPPAILLVRSDSLKKNKYDYIDYTTERYFSIEDQGFSDPLSYGGSLDTLVNRFGQTVHVYKYDVSLYFQELIMEDEINRGMMLTCYAGNRLPHGAILCGSNYPDITKRPYLSITYTLVNP